MRQLMHWCANHAGHKNQKFMPVSYQNQITTLRDEANHPQNCEEND